jgi:hypothetical protein
VRRFIPFAALLLTGCANPFADSCGGPSIFATEGFELRLAPGQDVVTVAPGGKVSVPICAVRYRFFDDPIDVAVIGLPIGVTTQGATIRKGHYSTKVTFEAEPAAEWPQPRKLDVSGTSGDFAATINLYLQVRGAPGSLDTSFGDAGEVTGDFGEPSGTARVGGVLDTGSHLFVAGNVHGPLGWTAAADWYEWTGKFSSEQSAALRFPAAVFSQVAVEGRALPGDRRMLLVSRSTRSSATRVLEYLVSQVRPSADYSAPEGLEDISATAGNEAWAVVGSAGTFSVQRFGGAGDLDEAFVLDGSIVPVRVAAGIGGDAFVLGRGSLNDSIWHVLPHLPPRSFRDAPPDVRALTPDAEGGLFVLGGLPDGGGYLLRLDENGETDGNFGFAGLLASSEYRPEVVLPDTDGSLILLRSHGDRCSVLQLDRIGRLLRVIDPSIACGATHVATLTADHRLLVGAESGPRFALRRYWL